MYDRPRFKLSSCSASTSIPVTEEPAGDSSIARGWLTYPNPITPVAAVRINIFQKVPFMC